MKLDRDTIRIVLILCSGVPFLLFLDRWWAHAALLGFLMTAVFFGVLLVPEYPPVYTSWFWKAMVPIFLVHSGIVSGVVWLNIKVPYMNKMPRWLYGFAYIILLAEWRLAIRLIEAVGPPVPA